MRAMILAAGLGTRMRPLSSLRAKPALPVRGVPVIAHLLWLLQRHGVREVIVNLHHLPASIEKAVEQWGPGGVAVTFSREATPLGTGGGIRLAADFLRQSDPALVLAGDTLLDVDLEALARSHREQDSLATLVLRRDPRMREFGSIGFNADHDVRRIGQAFDLGGEVAAGLFTGIRLLSPAALDWFCDRDDNVGGFEDLRAVLAPAIARGDPRVRAHCLEADQCAWEPAGTPEEYLHANFITGSPRLRLDALAARRGVRLDPRVVASAGARIPDDCQLERVVVWEDQCLARGTRARDGVFAEGRFFSCTAPDTGRGST